MGVRILAPPLPQACPPMVPLVPASYHTILPPPARRISANLTCNTSIQERNGHIYEVWGGAGFLKYKQQFCQKHDRKLEKKILLFLCDNVKHQHLVDLFPKEATFFFLTCFIKSWGSLPNCVCTTKFKRYAQSFVQYVPSGILAGFF